MPRQPAFAQEGFGAAAFATWTRSVYALASLKLRRTRFALTVSARLRHA